MKKTTPTVTWVLGFLLLSLYVNFLPRFFDQTKITFWFAYWAGFFVLTYSVCRFILGLRCISSLGLERHQSWQKNLGLGFLIGFSVYVLKYLVFYELGKFEIAGIMAPTYILPLLGQALLAMFFSSILNDITVRGYWYAYFCERNLLTWFIVSTTILYTMDDIWNEGFNSVNFAFSAILGFTFSYTALKTGSIWMSLGLHWGTNLMYRAMYGFDGRGVLQLVNDQDKPLFDYLSLLITATMLPIVYLVLKRRKRQSQQKEQPDVLMVN